jgi:hypothetical protein
VPLPGAHCGKDGGDEGHYGDYVCTLERLRRLECLCEMFGVDHSASGDAGQLRPRSLTEQRAMSARMISQNDVPPLGSPYSGGVAQEE